MGPDKHKFKCHGCFTVTLKCGSKEMIEVTYVCDYIDIPLLGQPGIDNIELITLKSNINTVKENEPQEDRTTTNIENDFKEVFEGLGQVKGRPAHIDTEEDATPFLIAEPRKVPIPLLEPLKTELDRMLEMGVIKKIEEPTDWCNPIVQEIKPNGKIRLCIDLTKLNAVANGELYQLDSNEETLAKIGENCKVMSKLHANSGYWQMTLDEKSQRKCAFITPFGRFCPTRAPFGLTSMPEIFNRKMDRLIEGLDGVVRSRDDFLIYGKDAKEHYVRLRRFFYRLKLTGITLNLEKCVFKVDRVEFLRGFISPEGVKPLNAKVEAIRNFPQLSSITELRRFLGMAQQLSRFCPKLLKEAEPLRGLLSVKNKFSWTEEHTETFEKIKIGLSSPATLALYDIEKKKIQTDGSLLNGISVVSYQQDDQDKIWKPVDCASRFLTETEKNYCPIELEMLAATSGMMRMNLYLQGLHHFTLEADHIPLGPILNTKLISDLFPRIQRMRMKMLKFNFTAIYVPGKKLKKRRRIITRTLFITFRN